MEVAIYFNKNNITILIKILGPLIYNWWVDFENDRQLYISNILRKLVGVFRKEDKLLLINQYVCYCINLAQI
jgi:hypothetical protein